MILPFRGAKTRHGWPWVTLGLIALNVAIFLYLLYLGDRASMALYSDKGAVAAKLSRLNLLSSPKSWWLPVTIFSSLFLHAGWVHLIGNMWFLWVFGEGLEDDLGHGRFLAFYLSCGFFACLSHVLAAGNLSAPLVGASGAIAGVLGGYLVRLTQAPIRTWTCLRLRSEVINVPAFVWLGIWVALQFYGLRQGGAVAWVAHLGGFFIGMLTVTLFTPVSPRLTLAPKKANPKGRGGRGKMKKK